VRLPLLAMAVSQTLMPESTNRSVFSGTVDRLDTAIEAWERWGRMGDIRYDRG
jgi:hypothetical protein